VSFETVDIFVSDTSPSEDPIEGAVVRVYSEDGKTFYTQATTDANGQAAFLLNTQKYQLRFYKQHVSFRNARFIEVLAAPAINAFDVPGELVSPPTVANTRFCVAYGHFINPDGSPARNVLLRFLTKFNPLILEGAAVLTPAIDGRTDEEGYFQIPLIRNGQYDVTVEGVDDYQRCISVPDAPNVKLPNLLFPVVDRAVLSPAGPFALSVGDEVQVDPTLIATDGNEVEDRSSVQWASSDPLVLSVVLAGNKLTLRALAAGTANITATRQDQSIVQIPDPGVRGLPVAVTVT
jgi:Bacterial Ig-like domain (group 2)